MDDARIERIRGWQDRDIRGPADLDASFTGAVEAGGRWLLVLDGQCVAGDPEWLHEGGTAYSPPHDALPLLFAMEDADGETQGRYYSEEVNLRDTHDTLTAAGFTGYVELAENVLSGDYYVVYHGGQSRSVGFQGNNGRLLTDDEAFETAADEVGIYTVESAPIDPQPLPDTADRPTPDGGDDSSNVAADGPADGSDDCDQDAASAGTPADRNVPPDSGPSPAESQEAPEPGTEGQVGDPGAPSPAAAPDPSSGTPAETNPEPDSDQPGGASDAARGPGSESAGNPPTDPGAAAPTPGDRSPTPDRPESTDDSAPESVDQPEDEGAPADPTPTDIAGDNSETGGSAAADPMTASGLDKNRTKSGADADETTAALTGTGDIEALEGSVDQIADRVNRIDRQLDEVTETLDELAAQPSQAGVAAPDDADNDGRGSEEAAGRSRLRYVVLLVILLLIGIGALDVAGVIAVPGMEGIRDGLRSVAGFTAELSRRV